MESLYLIDVSALAYRSFYAFINNPLKNSKGQETSAIFGFASHTLRLIQECKPTHIAFVKDLPKKTFRHALYKEYKAHRKPMPDSPPVPATRHRRLRGHGRPAHGVPGRL